MPERFSGRNGTHAKLLVARNARLTKALDHLLTAFLDAGLQFSQHADPMKARELGAAVAEAKCLLDGRVAE